MAFSAENHFMAANFDVDPVSVVSSIVEVSAPYAPVNIIHAGDTVAIKIDWTQTGNTMFLDMLVTAGYKYKAKVFLEKMGPGADPAVTTSLDELVVSAASQPYSLQFNLPALTAGVYKLVFTLNLYNAAETWTPWHSFEEKGMIEVIA